MTQSTIISNLSDRITIWRYMDFTKFVDLLESESLFFCNSLLFEDPLDSSLWNVVTEKAKKYKGVEKDLHCYFDKYNKSMVYANCWHINRFESAALWRLYLKSDEGIAIQSTTGRLKKALSNSPDGVRIFRVVYNKKRAGTLVGNGRRSYTPCDLAGLKHPSFKHEKELRAIIVKLRQPKPSIGIKVPINLGTLIQKVYIAPKTPEWFFKLVHNVSRKYGYDFTVQESKLFKEPFN